MDVKIKRTHPNSVIPKYAMEGDAGLDLVAVSKEFDEYGNVVYGTGLAFEIPPGFVGLLFPRSSNSKTDLYLTNHVGVVDSGYRAEVFLKYRNVASYIRPDIGREGKFEYLPDYEVGDRVGQLMIIPYPKINFIGVEELHETERNTGGFGSTGK